MTLIYGKNLFMKTFQKFAILMIGSLKKLMCVAVLRGLAIKASVWTQDKGSKVPMTNQVV